MNEEYVNHGMWELNDLNLRIGAVHTPALDELMMSYRQAQRAVADDEPRLSRQVKPYLGDLQRNALRNNLNRAKAAVMDYVLAHPEVLVIQRRLK